jgi:DNA adenine methylase
VGGRAGLVVGPVSAPPFTYYGGKQTLADRIVECLPPHRHYVEPFAGSLAVLLAKAPAPFETVNDLDGDLMTFWRVLRDHGEELARVCALTPHSRAEYEAARRLPDDLDDLERARRVWIHLTQGRGGRMISSSWRHYIDPADRSTSMAGYLRGYVERMRAAAERIALVSLECRPALEVIEKYGARDGVTLYVDPPYLGSTRAHSNRYAIEMRGDSDHEQLAAALNSCRAAVVLSGYPSALYDQLYAGWRRVDIPTTTGNGGDDRARTECLWINRQQEPTLFDHVAGGAA